MTLQPGIHYDIAARDYHQDCAPSPSLSSGIAKLIIEQSPKHAWTAHPKLNPAFEPDDSTKFDIGNVSHKLLIGRGKEIVRLEFDSWRTKEAQAMREKASAQGQLAVLTKDYETATQMVAAARAQLVAARLGDAFAPGEGHGEVVILWEEDGIFLRTMIDWLSADKVIVWDLKTSAANLAPHVVGNKIAEDGWDVQAAMIERGLDVLDPALAGRRRFRFIALENYPPYGLVPVELTEAHLTMGRKKLAVAVALWRMCITAGQWPGYPNKIIYPETPPWAETRWLQREADYHDSGIAGDWGNWQEPVAEPTR